MPFGYPPGPLPGYFSRAFDPLETLSYVAAVTQHIKLGTSVLAAFFHEPLILARRLATLDVLSRGRLIAGLGQGWMKEEFESTNASIARRGNGLSDYLAALRACWGPDPVQYEGRFYRIVRSDVGPKPRQPGGPPVLLGVGAPAALERAARCADGLNPLATSWKTLELTVRTYQALVREVGRDPQQMQIVVRSNHPISLLARLPEPRPPLSGSLEQVRQDVQRLAELGVGHFFVDLTPLPGEEQLALLAPLRAIAA